MYSLRDVLAIMDQLAEVKARFRSLTESIERIAEFLV